MKSLRVFNRQKTRRVDTRFLRRAGICLLEDLRTAGAYEIAVHLIGAAEMTRLNGQFLGHEGSTDVITFDYGEAGGGGGLRGEIFICVDDAVAQAREFRCTWPEEIARYVAHGLLHLQGHDDTRPAARRVMKRRENALIRALSRRLDLGRLGARGTVKHRQKIAGPLAR